jgi:hypothetical protein
MGLPVRADLAGLAEHDLVARGQGVQVTGHCAAGDGPRRPGDGQDVAVRSARVIKKMAQRGDGAAGFQARLTYRSG